MAWGIQDRKHDNIITIKMKSRFSTNWKRSVQARKQRKYVANAPLHIKGKLLHVHLSEELRKKHGKRSLRVRKGDKVKVLRGSHKGEEQKVDKVDTKNLKIYLDKITKAKIDGSKANVPFRASNLMITNLNLDDKKRAAKLKGNTQTEKGEQ